MTVWPPTDLALTTTGLAQFQLDRTRNAQMAFTFVDVRSFTPAEQKWTPVGNIAAVSRTNNTFKLDLSSGGRSLMISFLSSTCFRVRFNPAPNTNYAVENPSRAVVNRNFGPIN